LLIILAAELPAGRNYEVVTGTVAYLPSSREFDVILYIDVLEHIEDDGREMERAASHLKPNGIIIVLSPAYQRLFTSFDEEIGYFRRYTQASLTAAAPPGFHLERMLYVDSAGMLASLGNRFLLNSRMPSSCYLGQSADPDLAPA
jgi:hypothetical protein